MYVLKFTPRQDICSRPLTRWLRHYGGAPDVKTVFTVFTDPMIAAFCSLCTNLVMSDVIPTALRCSFSDSETVPDLPITTGIILHV